MAQVSSITFPNDHMLVKLLAASKSTDQQIIHDAYGFDKTYANLLADIVKTRDTLKASFPSSSLNDQGLLNEDHLYITVLTGSGYEFTVAFLAIRALGGACMPFAPETPLDEVKTFMSEAKSTHILSSKFLGDRTNEISEHIKQASGKAISVLPISSDAPLLMNLEVEIDQSIKMDPRSPSFVIFTSGTTGPPKGAVLPKCWMDIPSRPEPNSATISHRPPYWIGGSASILAPLFAGIEIYMMKETNNARSIWELLKTKKITHMGFSPGLLSQLKDIYVNEFTKLEDEERQKYLDGFKNITKMSTSGWMLSPQLQEFWTTLSGRSFEIMYGSTETGLVATKIDALKPSKIKHSIGTPWPGVQVKLSNGDEGEILVKHHMTFLHYLGNEEATKAAFDADGFVKTGDCAHLVEGEYVFDGRVTNDYIQIGKHRVPTIQVEEALAELPYISEAHVVGVPNSETGECCGALVRLGKDVAHDEPPTLDRIKADLSDSLPEHMYPELLRIMKEGEVVPITVSLKPIKRGILKQFFGVTDS